MPLFVLDSGTQSLVCTDVNSIPLNHGYKYIKKYCWGVGRVRGTPKKFYQHITNWKGEDEKVFTVRMWMWVAGRKREAQYIRIDITDEYAEGCQYLVDGDPIQFFGTLRYDKGYSAYRKSPQFIIKAWMVIPPYSADGREFCARKRAIEERRNGEMLSKIMEMGMPVPTLDDLEQYERNVEEYDGDI